MGVTYRIKCPRCNTIGNMVGGICQSCKSQISMDGCGFVDLYRMGSPYGIAAAFGIYIDGQPFGHIGNKETVRLVLPYGTHNLHVAFAANRRCNDIKMTVTPEQRISYAKVHIVPGFFTNKFVLEYANESEMVAHDPVPGQAMPNQGYASNQSAPIQQNFAEQQNFAGQQNLAGQQPVQQVTAMRNVFCSNCGTQMTVRATDHGIVTCPKCNNRFNV